jgi:excinuclease UvrABC ATPase subunit
VDRIVVRDDIAARLADSFETALELADGIADIEFADAPEGRRRCEGAGSPSSGTRRSPCDTRPSARGPREREDTAGSSPAVPAPDRPSGRRSGSRFDGEYYAIDDVPKLDKKLKHDIDVVVDRIVVRDDIAARLAETGC